jgi:hypothetical protein
MQTETTIRKRVFLILGLLTRGTGHEGRPCFRTTQIFSVVAQTTSRWPSNSEDEKLIHRKELVKIEKESESQPHANQMRGPTDNLCCTQMKNPWTPEAVEMSLRSAYRDIFLIARYRQSER